MLSQIDACQRVHMCTPAVHPPHRLHFEQTLPKNAATHRITEARSPQQTYQQDIAALYSRTSTSRH
jgi:hypothetical protein